MVVALIGLLGWNTYSLSQLKDQVKNENINQLKKQSYKEPIIIEEKNSNSDREEKTYVLFLDR